MATSSLKKSFVISSKKEASAFVKLFTDSLKNPPQPIKKVNYSIASDAEIKKILDNYAKQS